MPRQRSRSPLSPILATESATVRLFFILSVLLCSVNNAGLKTETWLLYCLRLRSRSPHNAKHSTSSIRKGVKSPTSGDAPTDQIPALIPTRLWWGEVGHIIDRCITVTSTFLGPFFLSLGTMETWADPDELVVCPYDPVHRVQRKRLQYRLINVEK